MSNLKRFARAVGDKVAILQITDDFATQESLLLSIKMFRELIMPYYKRGLDWVHQNTKMKVMLHSDGALFPLIPSLIEMGVDILNPVQVNARGMDPAKLKQTFGDKLVLLGWRGRLPADPALRQTCGCRPRGRGQSPGVLARRRVCFRGRS